MLTLTSHPENIKIAEIKHGKNKKRTDVYWHPTIKPELRNATDNLDHFFTEQFCDRFELSTEQSNNIKQHLIQNTVCEENQNQTLSMQTIYSKLSLNEEMDLRNTIMMNSNFLSRQVETPMRMDNPSSGKRAALGRPLGF